MESAALPGPMRDTATLRRRAAPTSNAMLAITREVSPSLAACELTHVARTPIDVALAVTQHHAYQQALAALGCRVLALAAEPAFPDAVFVEDVAVVLDEVAVMTRPGADSRRGEGASVAEVLRALPAAARDRGAGHARRRRRAAHRPHAVRRPVRPQQCRRHRAVARLARRVRLRGARGADPRLPAPQVGRDRAQRRHRAAAAGVGGSRVVRRLPHHRGRSGRRTRRQCRAPRRPGGDAGLFSAHARSACSTPASA